MEACLSLSPEIPSGSKLIGAAAGEAGVRY